MRSDNTNLTDFIFASDLLKNMRNVVIENDIEFEHKKSIADTKYHHAQP